MTSDESPTVESEDESEIGSEPKAASESSPDLGFKVHDRRHWTSDDDDDDAEQARSEVPSFVEHLQQQLEKKDKQLKEYIAAYKSEVAGGLEETKHRLQRDAEQRAKVARGEMVRPMLDVLETLERSLQLAASATDVETLAEGMRMVHLMMVQKLKEMGLQRIDTVGQPFDPNVHEALAVVEASDTTPRDTVADELSAGFTLDGRVVRPARVRVAK